MGYKTPILGTIGLINASVFYVTLRVFTQGDVVTYVNGQAQVESNLLMMKMGALGGFLLVSMIGLYITLDLLSDSDPNGKLKRDKERYLSWKSEFQRRQLPQPVKVDTEKNEQIEITNETNENEQIEIEKE